MNIFPKDKDGQLKIKSESFTAKTIKLNGIEKSLYKRLHGESFTAINGQYTTFTFTIPYPNAKFEAMEIINGDIADIVNFKVLDTVNGDVTGYPNYMLNQFGFNVFMDKSGYYEQRSQYDADVFYGLQLSLDFYNASGADKTIYINYILNEVKE